MKNSKNLLLGLILVVAFGAGVWWVAKPKPATNANVVSNTNVVAVSNTNAEFTDQCATTAAVTANVNGTTTVPVVTYSGSTGKNALELLQASHTVDATPAGFVNAIDGIKPVGNQFWLLCVNGKGAEVGARELVTNTSNAIEWRLGTF